MSQGKRRRSARAALPAPRDRSRDLLALLFLVVATAAAYWAVQQHPFISVDDGPYVYENPVVGAGLTWEGVRWAFGTGHASNWHPLTWLSHMLDVELYGVSNAGAHHRSAAFLHIVNSLLTFLVLLRLTGAQGRSFVVAALFALHPAHVESVAWVSERKDVLSQLFWLLAIGAYAEYARRLDWRWYAMTFVCLAGGLMSKPMLVTAPFLFLLLDYWPLERWGAAPHTAGCVSPSVATAARSFWQLVAEKIPFVALSLASSYVTYVVQVAGSSVIPQPLGHRLATAITAYARYLGTAAWPVDLAFLYPDRLGMWSAPQVLGALAVLAAISLAVLWLRRARYLSVGWLWYLGTLVPVAGFVGLGGHSMADRYLYMPMNGLAVMLVWGGADLARRVSWGPRAAAVAAALVLMACFGLTVRQVDHWSSSRALYSHALAVTQGNYIMHTNLASAAWLEGDRTAAIDHYRKAIRIEPRYPISYLNLGNLYVEMGRLDDAIPRYQKVLEIDPGNSDVHRRLGNALLRRQQIPAAVERLRVAVRLNPADGMAHHDLGLALAMGGQVEESFAVFLAGLEREPSNAYLHTSYGNALRLRGRLDEALEHHRRALELVPNQAGPHSTLGATLLMMGRKEEAALAFQTALRLDPNHAEARRGLAQAEQP